MKKNTEDRQSFMSSPERAIRDLLLERKSKNPKYSANALARDLGISAPFLSQVMSGKRNLSLEQKIKLADALEIKLPATTSQAKKPLSKVSLLQNSLEHDKILKYWYHFAILELAQTPNNSAKPKLIATQLAISEIEAKTAIDRLLEFGYISITRDQKIKRTKLLFIFDPKRSSSALRAFHHSRLSCAQNELNYFSESDVSQRNFQTIFVASSKTEIDRAKRKIASFTEELMQQLAQGPQEEVFQFSSQFFCIENKLIKSGTKEE